MDGLGMHLRERRFFPFTRIASQVRVKLAVITLAQGDQSEALYCANAQDSVLGFARPHFVAAILG